MVAQSASSLQTTNANHNGTIRNFVILLIILIVLAILAILAVIPDPIQRIREYFAK